MQRIPDDEEVALPDGLCAEGSFAGSLSRAESDL